MTCSASLTTAPNTEVKAIHPKAMPVILTTQAEVDAWLTAPVKEALALQRPLPDGALRIVARGDRTGDPPGAAVLPFVAQLSFLHWLTEVTCSFGETKPSYMIPAPLTPLRERLVEIVAAQGSAEVKALRHSPVRAQSSW